LRADKLLPSLKTLSTERVLPSELASAIDIDDETIVAPFTLVKLPMASVDAAETEPPN
jgi:hypothetical protein